MPKLAINATLDNLRKQMARGGQHGASPGSSGNVMPGPSAVTADAVPSSSGGATAGLGANPSRVGAPPKGVGSYQQIKGSPAPSSNSVRSHSLALGGLKHMV